MKKKLIIDLDGVVFEPVALRFRAVAQEKYGRIRGRIIDRAYNNALGRRMFTKQISDVLYTCASTAKPRSGVLTALDALSQMPDVKIEFCSQLVYPQHTDQLCQRYQLLSPAMASANYVWVSPTKSRREKLWDATRTDDLTMSYLISTNTQYMDNWPSTRCITPVIITPSFRLRSYANTRFGARGFKSLESFRKFLVHNR